MNTFRVVPCISKKGLSYKVYEKLQKSISFLGLTLVYRTYYVERAFYSNKYGAFVKTFSSFKELILNLDLSYFQYEIEEWSPYEPR